MRSSRCCRLRFAIEIHGAEVSVMYADWSTDEENGKSMVLFAAEGAMATGRILVKDVKKKDLVS